MRFGIEKTDITPGHPVYLAGYGSRVRKHEGVLQPITMRAVLLEANKTLLIVAIDATGGDRSFVDGIKAALKESFGLTVDQVLINFSHTHYSVYLTGLDPASRLGIYSMGREGYPNNPDELEFPEDEAYFCFLRDKLIEMVASCYRNLCEGELLVGSCYSDFAVSRRVPRGNGVTDFAPNPHAEIDRQLFVYQLIDGGGCVRGVIYSLGCHPTALGSEVNLISNDYAGFASAAIEEQFPEAIAVFLQGCGAELKTSANVEDGQFVQRGIQEVRRMGESLAADVLRVVRYRTVECHFKSALESCSLPVLPENPEFYRKQLELEPYGYENAMAASMLIARLEGRAGTSQPLYISVWELDLRTHLIAIEGEVSTGYSLCLRQFLSKGDMAVLGYSNGVPGYIPTRSMIAEGGYEAECNYFYRLQGPFAPEIEDIIVGRVCRLMHCLE